MRGQYPSVASNLLKMYVDVELFLVTLVGLILRIENADLSNDPLPLGLRSLLPDSCGWLCTGTLYGDLLWVLLMLTLVPIIVSVIYRSPEEKAQALLHKIARVDLDDETFQREFAGAFVQERFVEADEQGFPLDSP